MRNAVNKYGFDVFDVFPLSFRVPKEKLLFENMHRKLVASHQNVVDAHRQNISWILKISGKDRAEGIQLIQSPKELRRQKGIVQQYIKNPYLLNGHKFTMRVYAAYTSLDPVRIYVYPEGFCHISDGKILTRTASCQKSIHAHNQPRHVSK